MAVSNLAWRVLVAAVFGPLFLVMFWVGGFLLLVSLCVVVVMGAREFYHLQENKGLQPWMWFGVVASLTWCFGVYWFLADFSLYYLVGLTISIFLLSFCRREEEFRLADAGATLMGVLYIGFFGSFALLVRNFPVVEMSENEIVEF